jgi:ubiquinone/menaquinone biosynthesis C-methylase UbiE
VLDASCGSGAAALTAADAVGPFGCVLAVDCDEQRVHATRAEAVRKGIGNLTFHSGGLGTINDNLESFDVVVCSFANFTAPEVLVRELWNWVRVDGEMVISTFLDVASEPVHAAFLAALQRVRPGAAESNFWEEHTRHVAGVEKLLTVASAAPTNISVQTHEIGVRAVEEWWTGMISPYYRTALRELSASELSQVRQETLTELARANWQRARLNVLSATVWKRKSSVPAQ